MCLVFFTNIPLYETVNFILDSLFSETHVFIVNGCSFNKAHFKKLLGFAIKNNNFIVNEIVCILIALFLD